MIVIGALKRIFVVVATYSLYIKKVKKENFYCLNLCQQLWTKCIVYFYHHSYQLSKPAIPYLDTEA